MKQLTPNMLKEAEYLRTIFAVSVPPEIEPEDILKPEFWAHVAKKLQPTSRIEVMPETGEWFAELIVIACAHNWAQVCQLRFHELTESKKPETKTEEPLFKAVFRGNNKKFCVHRISDGSIVKEELPTMAAAQLWISEHMKTLAATPKIAG